MANKLQLVSQTLCPYVQRAVIVAAEKGVAFERVAIDLDAKPAWFLEVSPTGKVPLLRVTDERGAEHVLFESAAICEYLDETNPPWMLPADPLARAKERAWIEFASGSLGDIAGFYVAPDATSFEAKEVALRRRFVQVEAALAGPWFSGAHFGLVDAAFAPVLRYLDAFEALAGAELAPGLVKVGNWRAALAERPSVVGAVGVDFAARFADFLRNRNSHLSGIIAGRMAVDEGAARG